MSANRVAHFQLFIGTNGTGKTTIMRKFLALNPRNLVIPANRIDKAWDDVNEIPVQWAADPQNPKKQIAVIPHLKTFTGTGKIFIDGDPRIFDAIVHPQTGFMQGGLFMDDFKNYIRSRGTLPANVSNLFSDRRHRMLDIFAATHSLQKVNPDFFDYDPKVLLFMSSRPPHSLKDKIDNYDLLQVVHERVKQNSEKNPHYFEIFNPA